MAKKGGGNSLGEFLWTFWNFAEHLAQADAGQLKRHHFDTCPTMMTSHPVHTGGGNRWFVSSAIYIGCFLKHFPPSKRCYDGRWIDEHMKENTKVKEDSFKWQHDNSICLSECDDFIYGYISMCVWTSMICFLNDIWDTVINIGHLWFYAIEQIRINALCMVIWSGCVYHKTDSNKTWDMQFNYSIMHIFKGWNSFSWYLRLLLQWALNKNRWHLSRAY